MLHFLFVIFKLIIRWKPNSSRISVRIPTGIHSKNSQFWLLSHFGVKKPKKTRTWIATKQQCTSGFLEILLPPHKVGANLKMYLKDSARGFRWESIEPIFARSSVSRWKKYLTKISKFCFGWPPEKNIEDQLRVTSLWPVATKPSLEAETEISLDQKHQI